MVVYLVVNHSDIGNMNVKVRILTIFLGANPQYTGFVEQVEAAVSGLLSSLLVIRELIS